MTLREEGIRLAMDGKTCLEEVLAVTHSEDTNVDAPDRTSRAPEPVEVT